MVYFMASVDDAETNKEFAESLHSAFPLLSDPGKGVAMAYGVVNDDRPVPYRWTYIIGPDGTVLRVDKEINPATSGADLVRHLTELGVAKR